MTSPILTTIVSELSNGIDLVDNAELQNVAETILEANRVFVGGAGRSGFVARGFANRLLHIGLDVAFVGEPTTPPITAGDLFVAISGSGRTASLLTSAEKAKGLGASVATITLDPNGPISKFSDARIVLPGTTRQAAEGQENGVTSIQPVGTLFEQLAWLTCDALVVLLRDRTGQNNDELLSRHANME